MSKIYEIKIIVKEQETKEGKKFNTYKVVESNGKLVDCRFRKDVEGLPKKTCIMVVKQENINYDERREFPCYWVKAIEELKDIEVQEKDLPF